VARISELSITKTDGVDDATPGGSLTYTVVAANAGPSSVTGAMVSDTLPAVLSCTWTCGGTGTCTGAGAGSISDSVNLPTGTSVTYTLSCTVALDATGTITNTATIAVPGGTTDPTPGNNSATDVDKLPNVFADGFETGDRSRWSAFTPP